MKNLFFLSFILFSIASAQAQGRLELKASVLGVFESAVELSGEYVLAPRWGIEAGVGFLNKIKSETFCNAHPKFVTSGSVVIIMLES